MDLLEKQLKEFPRGKHDDTLDGIYYATRKLLPPDHVVTQKDERDLKHFIIPEKASGWQTR